VFCKTVGAVTNVCLATVTKLGAMSFTESDLIRWSPRRQSAPNTEYVFPVDC